MLVFLSVCMESCACACVSQCLYGILACVSQCLYGILCFLLGFSVFVWTIVLALAFLSVCMDSCGCAYVSQCLYGLLCLRFRFSVFLLIPALDENSVRVTSRI